jgi:hypothetical protein
MKMYSSWSKITILLFLLTAFGFKAHSQTNTEKVLYNWYDTVKGKESIDLNNGSLHVNPYKTLGDNTMYYIADKYSKGSISYDNQSYYNVNLKYDLYRDIIVFNPYGQPENIGVNLIQEKTKSFSLNGKNFANLSTYQTPLQEYIKGYFEELIIGNEIILYTKHHKDILEFINNDHIYYSFSEKNNFILKYKNAFHQINSKKEIALVFPQYKKNINTYYSQNKKMEKSNKALFTENILNFINGFLTSTSN